MDPSELKKLKNKQKKAKRKAEQEKATAQQAAARKELHNKSQKTKGDGAEDGDSAQKDELLPGLVTILFSSLLFHGEKVIDFPGRRLFSSVPFSSTLVSVSGSEGPSKRLNSAFKDASEVRCTVQGLCQGQFIECELVA